VVTALKGAKQITVGRLHGCALREDGRVACWGGNWFGQLGDDTANGCSTAHVERRQEPGLVPFVSDVEAIAMGDTGTCVRVSDGTVRCWGQIGFPRAKGVKTRCKAASFEGLDHVKQVVAGAHHGCALREDGTVYCWGTNAIGQLGAMKEGTTPRGHGGGGPYPRFPPIKVAKINDVIQISSFGTAHTCALRRSGQVVCWGRNANGQLGDGTTTSRWAPVSVVGLEKATAIATGYDSTCALTQRGGVLCWGSNEHGQLGDGTRRQRVRPVEVDL
jgi:alpha-tubulin suppressor-like RCC1 family protein